jgi:LacI family transcriptional regulator
MAKSEPSTLMDVAQLAGVSPSTVSRILNGTAKVTEAKRLAVEAAIKKLQFRPNLAARGLRNCSTRTIGVLTQDLESPYFTRGAKGVDDALMGSGYAPIVVPGHWNPIEEWERARMLIARRVDGLVILGGGLSDPQIAELAQQQPVAVTGRDLQAPDVFSFQQDQTVGARLATAHLIELGHRHIAHISGPADHQEARQRKEGFLLAHKQAGLSVNPALIIEADFMETGGMRAMSELLACGQPMTAVFCANDQMLWGAKLTLHRRGLRIPADMSLVGFDDLPQSVFLSPPLTTVHQNIYEMGFSAAKTLLMALNVAGEPPPPVPPIGLVVRETTARCRIA